MRKNRSEIDGIKYEFNEVHDGKMSYCLTQYGLYTRKKFPYLLCSCSRGEGVINDDHECRILPHSEQVDAYIRSEQRWNDKRRRDKHYKYFEHMSWIDIHNQGVSHFGIHPDDLPRDSIRFDVFHL